VTADPNESVNLLTTERVDPAHLAIAAALGSRWGSSFAHRHAPHHYFSSLVTDVSAWHPRIESEPN
jgi:hypothetical protein